MWLVGGLPDGACLVDVGEQRLKDVDRLMRVFQATHPDLVGEFPEHVSAFVEAVRS